MTTARNYNPDLSDELRRIEPYDFSLLTAVCLLLSLGAVLVYSATITEDALEHGNGAATLTTHLVHITLGMGALLTGMLVPYRTWRRFVYPILGLVLALLIAVIFVGTTAGNAKRWLSLPGFSIQPAEVAKLAFIMFLAYSLEKKAARIKSFAVAFVPHLMVMGLLILLCLFQPDFGTCIILSLLLFSMLFVAGTRTAYIVLFFLAGVLLVYQGIEGNDMRYGRVMAFIDPWAHRVDRGYQMVNSLIAYGSGGLTGQSLGFGGQTITGFLPEGHTDFILAVLGEQLGFLGVASVVTLFLVILIRGLKIASEAREDFGRYLAFGITLLICMQAAINMLVSVALIPTKGLTLPFVSYGGSSLLTCCISVGILLNISRDIALSRAAPFVPSPPTTDTPAKPKRKRRRRKVSTKQLPLEEVIG